MMRNSDQNRVFVGLNDCVSTPIKKDAQCASSRWPLLSGGEITRVFRALGCALECWRQSHGAAWLCADLLRERRCRDLKVLHD